LKRLISTFPRPANSVASNGRGAHRRGRRKPSALGDAEEGRDREIEVALFDELGQLAIEEVMSSEAM